MRRCRAKNRRGVRCRSRPLNGKDLCAFHADPARHRAISRAGARQRGRQLRKRGLAVPAELKLENRADAGKVLARVANEVYRGALAARDCNAIVIAIGVYVRDVLEEGPGDGPCDLVVLDADGNERDEAVGREAQALPPADAEVLRLTGTDDDAAKRAAQAQARAEAFARQHTDCPPTCPVCYVDGPAAPPAPRDDGAPEGSEAGGPAPRGPQGEPDGRTISADTWRSLVPTHNR